MRLILGLGSSLGVVTRDDGRRCAQFVISMVEEHSPQAFKKTTMTRKQITEEIATGDVLKNCGEPVVDAGLVHLMIDLSIAPACASRSATTACSSAGKQQPTSKRSTLIVRRRQAHDSHSISCNLWPVRSRHSASGTSAAAQAHFAAPTDIDSAPAIRLQHLARDRQRAVASLVPNAGSINAPLAAT